MLPRPRPSTDLDASLARGDRVLFLCSGNILRSAFAEVYARHLRLALPVRSGATTYRNAFGPHPEAQAALRARGVAPATWADFRPTHLDQLGGELRPGTLVLGMTRDHLDAVAGCELAGAHLLPELMGEPHEIADPYFDGHYRECFAEIARCVEELEQRLRKA